MASLVLLVQQQGVLLLREIAHIMTTEQPEMRLSIEGHTDDIGDPQENANVWGAVRGSALARLLSDRLHQGWRGNHARGAGA